MKSDDLVNTKPNGCRYDNKLCEIQLIRDNTCLKLPANLVIVYM